MIYWMCFDIFTWLAHSTFYGHFKIIMETTSISLPISSELFYLILSVVEGSRMSLWWKQPLFIIKVQWFVWYPPPVYRKLNLCWYLVEQNKLCYHLFKNRLHNETKSRTQNQHNCQYNDNHLWLSQNVLNDFPELFTLVLPLVSLFF
jgi:hypothetical protein